MSQINLQVGDLVFHDTVLCPITSLSPTGVMIKKGLTHRFIYCEVLYDRKFEFVIEFKRGDILVGNSHADTEEKALKEKEFLESMGWQVRIYKREVK